MQQEGHGKIILKSSLPVDSATNNLPVVGIKDHTEGADPDERVDGESTECADHDQNIDGDGEGATPDQCIDCNQSTRNENGQWNGHADHDHEVDDLYTLLDCTLHLSEVETPSGPPQPSPPQLPSGRLAERIKALRM